MTERTNEGLADMAQVAERDHEVQMARADLYKIAKYAIKLHDMLKGVSEAEGIEGWQQSKITKAADYISSVYHSLDYDMKFGEGEVAEGKSPHKKGTKKYKKHMAAMHANESEYKNTLYTRLQEKTVKEIDEVAGPDKCWPGHRKVGTQKGTGKNAGKRVNKCKKIESEEEKGKN